MRAKIEQLAKGIFEYETPNILVSEEKIQISVVAGNSYSGSFTIKNSKNTPIHGMLYTSNVWLELDKKTFNEIENTVNYCIRAEKYEPGESLNAYVSIVSDCGEQQIPFNINIEAPYVITSLGKIKDLFQFTNLAKADWAEALKIFQSDKFNHVLLYYDKQYNLLYENLLKSRSISQAMEEFLIEVHKKLKINLSVDKLSFHYHVGEESFQDKLVISKDNWGYTEISIKTDAPFISVEQNKIVSDDFIGNTYPLDFVIDPSIISTGIHTGKIYISTIHQTITIEVICKSNNTEKEINQNRLKIKQCHSNIITNYLNFRTNRMTLNDYVMDTETILSKIIELKSYTKYQIQDFKDNTQNLVMPKKALEDNTQNKELPIEILKDNTQNKGFPIETLKDNTQIKELPTETLEDKKQPTLPLIQLMQAHLYILAGKDIEAAELLAQLEDKIDIWVESGIDSDQVSYCSYLYLETFLKKDDNVLSTTIETIQNIYEQNRDWKLLWFLLNIDKKYESNTGLKLADLKTQFEEGCHSPILYYEAVTIYNKEPYLLHELGQFEIQVLHFGLKYHYLTEDTATQFTYLASKLKNFDKLVYHCLENIYSEFHLKETLVTICSLLIKGNQTKNTYFKWFSLGVEEQLRITQLYEYYLYTINEEEDIKLPQSVLLYFIYNSGLSDRKKAYLYAYIIKKKEENPSVYNTYLKHLEQFARKQIMNHSINPNLAIIYDDILIPDLIDYEVAKNLPFIMYKQEIYCQNNNIKSVFVVHKELEKEVYAPFVNGVAQVDIFTENAEIFLVDAEDNLYVSTVEYTLNKLIRSENYSTICEKLEVNNSMLLLNLTEKALIYQKFDEKSIRLRKKSLQLNGLREEYYNDNILALIYFYYDNYEGELLESFLHQINIHSLNRTDRNKVVEIFIVRDLYEHAKLALKEYGFEGLSLTRLIKYCSRMLQIIDVEDKKSRTIVNLCYYIFKQGKYNEDILAYLVKYFSGTTSDMLEVWKSASAFEMDTLDLEERLLSEMLFTENNIQNAIPVFMSYYKAGGSHNLVKAFLNYNGYKYVVKDRVIQTDLFPIMKKEVTYEENDIWMVALLKQYRNQGELTEEELRFIEININRLVNKGIILPFFQEYKKNGLFPSRLNNKCFVEYKTNPVNKVQIHYQMEDKAIHEEFITEDMNHVFMGIFVKEFVVFYNESVHYYITEESPDGQVNITESLSLVLNQDLEIDEDIKYNHINYILTAIDMQDESTIIDSIDNYIKKDYAINKIFNPIW